MIHTLTKNVHCNKFASNERFYTANSPQFTPDFGDASPYSHVRQLANSGNFGYARQ